VFDRSPLRRLPLDERRASESRRRSRQTGRGRSPLRRRPLVLVRPSESTPDARGSADSGVASICGHSWQADSGRLCVPTKRSPRRRWTPTRRSPDASVDFNQTESKGNECPQTKSAERVASGVHLRADRSTPDARGSADSGVASICGNSLHADSGRGHADEFRSSDHHGSASPARTARKRAATASSGSTPLEAIDSAVAERSSARGRAFGFREPSSIARR